MSAADWPTIALANAGTWLSGGTPPTSVAEYWGGSIPWITSGALTDFRVRDSDRRVTERGVNNGTRRVPKNTILMVVRGMSLKTEFRIGITQCPVTFGQDCKALMPGPAFDPEFLAYAIQSMTREVLDLVDEAGHGTGRLQMDLLQAVEVPRPELDEQRAIAATVAALDDRIDSNRRLIRLVPDLIRAKALAALDVGNEDVAVATLARFVNGGAYTKGASGSGRMVIRIAELNSGPGASTVYNDIDVPDDKTARAGDILMSWSGSLGVYRWYREQALINQHIFKVLPTGYPAWLVFDRLDAVMSIFRGIAKDKATTMGHIQRGHLESTTIKVPSDNEITRLDTELGPLWGRLLVAEQECERLAALRDVLLPELFSGRIRVPEAQEAVS